MDKLKDGFGLGIGAMLGIGAVVLFSICGVCVVCFGLTALVAAGRDNPQGAARLRPTPAVVQFAPGPEQSSPPVDSPPTASLAAPPSAPVEVPVEPPTESPGVATVFVVGQDALAGDIRWKVLEAVDLGNHLQSDNQFVDPIDTSGKLVKVHFEIENRGSEVKLFSSVNLVDSQGRKFEKNTDASIWYIDNKESCTLEQLNPNLPKICTMIFELPLDATGLKLQAGDLDMFGGSEILIDLGM